MRPAQAIKTCLIKSFNFSGRASRSEFWWFVPPWMASALAVCAFLTPYTTTTDSVLGLFLALAVLLIPAISASIRRNTDPNIDLVWTGWGFSVFLFGFSLFNLTYGPPLTNISADNTPLMVCALLSFVTGVFIFSRRMTVSSYPNSNEVPS